MDIDTLMLTIVQRQDADTSIRALNEAGLEVTAIASAGGFLGASNVTLLIGLPASDVEKAMAVLKTRSHHRTVHTPRETDVGGAIVFVLPVARFIHLGTAQPTVISQREHGDPGATNVIVAIVSQQQSDRLLKVLTDWSYRGTLMSTTGGFSRRRNATLLIGARSDRVDSIVEQIRRVCEQDLLRDSAVTIFVLDCARYERM